MPKNAIDFREQIIVAIKSAESPQAKISSIYTAFSIQVDLYKQILGQPINRIISTLVDASTLTHEQIADKAHISRRTLHNILHPKGDYTPDPISIMSICIALGVWPEITKLALHSIRTSTDPSYTPMINLINIYYGGIVDYKTFTQYLAQEGIPIPPKRGSPKK